MSTETTGTESGLSRKGLAEGSVGLLGAIVIGVSCIAPITKIGRASCRERV